MGQKIWPNPVRNQPSPSYTVVVISLVALINTVKPVDVTSFLQATLSHLTPSQQLDHLLGFLNSANDVEYLVKHSLSGFLHLDLNMAQYIANAHGVTLSVNLALPLGYVLHVQRLFMGLRPSPPVVIGSSTSGTPASWKTITLSKIPIL